MVPANAATITGNAGSAFCNFNAIGDLKADASVGCNAKAGNIIALTYYVSYTGSAMPYSNDYGFEVPNSSTWGTTKIPAFKHAGTETATFSGSGILSTGQGSSVLNPTDVTYVY